MSLVKSKASKTNVLEFGRLLKALPGSFQKLGNDYVQGLAESAAKTVQTRIRRQLYNHTPLNPEYLARKIKQGYDRRILIRTSTYVDNIGARKVKQGNVEGFQVGVPENKQEKEGVPLTLIGRVHERGTSKTPARPHFAPVLNELKASIPTLKRNLVKKINRQVRTKMKEVGL